MSDAASRRFMVLPPPEGCAEAPRRIWELDPGVVFVVLGVSLEPRDLAGIFLACEGDAREGCREDLLLREAVIRCTRPCLFAREIERRLDARTLPAPLRSGRCPLAELAACWLGIRDVAGGRQLAALLWNLARDRRWIVRPLLDMVHGDIWVRALRLLSETADRPPQAGALPPPPDSG